MEIRGPSEDAADKIEPVVDRVAELQKAQTRFYHRVLRREHQKALYGRVHGRSEEGRALFVPLTLIILLVAFGALVAAGIPLLLG